MWTADSIIGTGLALLINRDTVINVLYSVVFLAIIANPGVQNAVAHSHRAIKNLEPANVFLHFTF